jgi:hypothetical protein
MPQKTYGYMNKNAYADYYLASKPNIGTPLHSSIPYLDMLAITFVIYLYLSHPVVVPLFDVAHFFPPCCGAGSELTALRITAIAAFVPIGAISVLDGSVAAGMLNGST